MIESNRRKRSYLGLFFLIQFFNIYIYIFTFIDNTLFSNLWNRIASLPNFLTYPSENFYDAIDLFEPDRTDFQHQKKVTPKYFKIYLYDSLVPFLNFYFRYLWIA